jgi:hypothetical protein
MLHYDSAERITPDEVMTHPWVKQHTEEYPQLELLRQSALLVTLHVLGHFTC